MRYILAAVIVWFGLAMNGCMLLEPIPEDMAQTGPQVTYSFEGYRGPLPGQALPNQGPDPKWSGWDRQVAYQDPGTMFPWNLFVSTPRYQGPQSDAEVIAGAIYGAALSRNIHDSIQRSYYNAY